ncbi:MAG: sulfatase [Chitinophagaceae bacterium]
MKNLKKKLLCLFHALFIICSSNLFSQDYSQPRLPNIIVFIADDMGLMDTSVPFIVDSAGNPVRYPLNSFYRTPNMEKLAKQGIRFSNFYAHSVCSPTRTSMMTGQNSARHRTTNWIKSEDNNRNEFGPAKWNWEGLNKQSVTLPKLLQQKGYRTIHVGKAHFAPLDYEGENPLNLGFDINIAGSSIGQPGSYYGMNGFGNINGNKRRAVPGLEKYWNKDIFLTEALTLEANEAVSQAKRDGKPFYLYMSHYALHAPFEPDPRFADHYKASGKNDKAQAYATLVEGMDKSLGDIMTHIKKLGLAENTLIIFLGDNGSDAPLEITNEYSSSQPLKGKKGNNWEGGMRVPFIAAWVTPDNQSLWQKKLPIPQNEIQQQMGTVIDLFPTITNLVGVSAPKTHVLDGFGLADALKGSKNKKRKEIFLNHFPHDHRSSYFTSLVKNDWKAIYQYQVEGKPGYELFNLKNDPFETTNLANKDPKMLKKMIKEIAEELKHDNALYPEKDGKPLPIIIPE